MAAIDWMLAAIALTGHLALGIALFNRLHAVGMHRTPRRLLEMALALGFFAALAGYGWSWWQTGVSPFAAWRAESTLVALVTYANFCLLAAIAILPYWLWPRLRYRVPEHLINLVLEERDPAVAAGPIPLQGAQARLLSLVPGNEILKLQVARKTLRLPSLPPELAGITITHLSDLHFTGEIGWEYYDHVVDEANRLQSDVLILSGDIIESTECESWITEVLGRLQCPLGKYFVLGNHDKRMPDVPRVRQLLVEAGMIDVGGRYLHVSWKGCRVLVAGNERPWFDAASDDDLRSEAASPDHARFRLLVSHSPDQLGWARRHGFDLVLAGHNHGGQVCFPLVGPLIAPSLYGTRYAGGLYFEPPTLLHVSRGISGEHPIRIRCLPELAQLKLVRGDARPAEQKRSGD